VRAVGRGDQAEQQRRARGVGELFIAIQRHAQADKGAGQVAVDLRWRERLDDECGVDLERWQVLVLALAAGDNQRRQPILLLAIGIDRGHT
jgi:hypothetical protein